MITHFRPPAAKSRTPEKKLLDILAFMALVTVGVALWPSPDSEADNERQRQEYIDEAARLQADHDAALAAGDDARAAAIKQEFDELMDEAREWAQSIA